MTRTPRRLRSVRPSSRALNSSASKVEAAEVAASVNVAAALAAEEDAKTTEEETMEGREATAGSEAPAHDDVLDGSHGTTMRWTRH